jgi:hypothetical protein
VALDATANVNNNAIRMPPPFDELHAFGVVYVRFANIYHIQASIRRPGAF